MSIKIYSGLAIAVFALSLFSSCNKQITFKHENRLHIADNFRLQEVRSKNGELYKKYSYDGQMRLKQVVYNGNDFFNLQYADGTAKLIKFNNYEVNYDQQDRLIEVKGPELSNTVLKYLPNQIQIIQTTRTIVPGPKPTQIDTLNLLLNDKGEVLQANLLPKKIGYEFRYDQYANPYIHNEKQLLPILLIYPLAQVFKEISSLQTGKNLMRIYQNASNISNSVEKPMVEDITYRYDHLRYDIPTSSSNHGLNKSERHFLYSE